MPTQKAMNLNLFEVTETAILHNSGATTISKTNKVTAKGQQYLINHFLNKKLYENNLFGNDLADENEIEAAHVDNQ
jgi:anti-repressor protein